jgi:uncharacterized protein
MIGIDATTGRHLGGAAHIKQSIRDILTTRIGTRVMRREYGSNLPLLVDNPINEALKVELFAATAEALARWEPRFRLEAVYLSEASSAGRIAVTVEGRILVNNEPVRLEGIEIS